MRKAQQGWIAEVQAKCSCTEETGQAKETLDEVLLDDRKKLGMDSADPQNRFEWRGRLRERLVKQAEPSIEKKGFREKQALKWI